MVFLVIMAPVTNINPPETPTPETPSPTPRTVRPKTGDPARKRGYLPWVLILLALVAAFLIWKFPSFKAQAELGSAYAARIGCSCRYVEERSLDSCQSDFEPGTEMVSISEDPATKTITGSVPLLASRSARYAGASGCLLNPED
jgi:hypothetical protein